MDKNKSKIKKYRGFDFWDRLFKKDILEIKIK